MVLSIHLMPALPDTPFCVQVKFTGTYSGGKWANILHVGHSSPGLTTADLNAFALLMRNAWNTHLTPLVNNGAVMNGVEALDLSSHSGAVGTNASSSTGLRSSGSALPAQVALVLSWKIARRYRGGHPRTYLVGMSAGDTTLNTNWTGAYLGVALTNAEAFRVAVSGMTLAGSPGVYLACLSYYTGGALRPEGRLDPITAVQVHTRIDTQRRRLGREIL